MMKTRWFEQRWVLPVLLSLFVLIPEVRRLIDWQIGFTALAVVNVIPLAALALFITVPLQKRNHPFPRALTIALWAWTIGFGLAVLVGLLTGQRFSLAYELAGFALPVLIVYVIAQIRAGVPLFRDISWTLAGLGAFVGLYGLYQYVSPPPWDVLWVNNSGLSSIGVPEPFGLRIFSTLNSYGTLADFLALAILTQLPFLRADRALPARLASVLAMLVALALTFDRSAWLGLLVGAFAYVCLSPRRWAALGGLGAIAVLGALLFVAGPTIFGQSPAFEAISARFSTLTDVDSDTSYQARQYETAATLEATRQEPIGQGIGTLGTATKLGDAGATTTVDGGYLSRLLEMGVFGFAAYLVALAAALALAYQAWSAAKRSGRSDDAMVSAACFAVQITLAALDVSSDHHVGFTGLLFWVAVAVPARQLMLNPAARPVPHAQRAYARS